MKTIALSEKTFSILQKLKAAKKAGSFEEIVVELIVEKENIPKSLFGALKKKTKSFTPEDRKGLWNDRI